MENELKDLLEENLRISKENNKMLHKMRRAVWWGVLWKIIVWVIILGGPVYVYYTYLPQINSFMTQLQKGQVSLQQAQDVLKNLKLPK